MPELVRAESDLDPGTSFETDPGALPARATFSRASQLSAEEAAP